MAYYLSPIGNSQIIDANGDPLVGGTISTFLAGTSTAETTYTDDTGGTSQGVVMTLNSLGYPTNGPVWMLGGVPLKFIIKNAAGVTQSTFDDISGIGDTSSVVDQWQLYGAAPTYISATSFSVVGDQTNTFELKRKIKSTNSGGTVYSTIATASFGAGVTTVTVTNTSGVLDAGMSAVSYGVLTAVNDSIPTTIARAGANSDITSLTGLTTAIQLAALRGHISGLILSNNATDATNDIDIASGSAVDTTTTYLMSLTGPFVKRLDAAWAVGTGNGGLDTGSIGDNEYHVWLIRKDSDGTIDALFSLSATAPTMPAGYTAKRRIGSIFRASAAIRTFIQKGDRFYFKTLPLDVDATLSTTATSYTVTAPAGSVAILNALASRGGADAGVYVYSPEVTDQAHSTTVSPLSNLLVGAAGVALAYGAGQIEVLTNSSSQIRAVAGSASTTFKVATVGYIDTRGKDA